MTFVNHFAADVDPVKAKVMFAVQQPLAGSALGEVMGVPAWKSLPSWFLVAEGDQASPPDAERLFAKRMNATTTEVSTNHVAMVSHPDEFIRAKGMMEACGVDVENVTLGIMVEIPASAILIEDFIMAGIKFASFGTNDLIQYTIAVDRNNENVATMYKPKHPAVLKTIHETIQVCRKYGVECSICGQAGSDPEMAEWLVEHGISSLSANIDAIAKIRDRVARTEQRMILEAARRVHAREGV